MTLSNGAAIVIRIATAAMGLLALKLTHAMLMPSDFATFSLVLFSVAVGSSVASPINRHFWAHNSREMYVDAIFWTTVILSVVIALFSAAYWIYCPVTLMSLVGLVFAGVCYAFSKVIDRFTYGQVLLEGNISQALSVSLLTVGAELAAVSVMFRAGTESLILRLLCPVVLQLLLMALLPSNRALLRELTLGAKNAMTKYSIVGHRLAARQGLNTIALTVAITFAVMIDRLVIPYFPIGSRVESADYLLVLSYTIALQSLMNASIDLARKHVFRDQAWVIGAKGFAKKSILSLMGIGLVAIVVFPLLQFYGVIPETIECWLWAALIVRAVALLIVSYTCVDFVQIGQVERAFPPLLAMLAIIVVFLFLLGIGLKAVVAALWLILPTLLLCGRLCQRFFHRIPSEGTAYANA
ncbi:MAG: hypothetical protein ACO1RT_14770 [Planctomycetaceae bacterium]